MKLMRQLVATTLLWAFTACNHSNDTLIREPEVAGVIAPDQTYKEEDKKRSPNTADTVASNQNQKPPQVNAGAPAKEDWDKKIIKTANLNLEVKSYERFNELLHSSAKALGGYVAQEEQHQSDYAIENTIVIKVPVDLFDKAVAVLTPAGEKLMEKKITAEDVTGEMVDTKARMEAKKRIRDRYLDLLKQAKNMEEILQVQNEINQQQENIEAAGGRINYLGHAAAFSTINMHFYQVLKANDIRQDEPSYSLRVIESLKSGLHWFAELFILLVSLWPLWAVITVLWILIRKTKIFALKKVKQG